MPFDIGDKAYVPNHGVGIVKEIQSVDLGGQSYQMYVIKILDDGLTYFVPVKLTWSAAGVARADTRPTNTSGDFVTLAGTDGFVELPAAKQTYAAGSAARLFRW